MPVLFLNLADHPDRTDNKAAQARRALKKQFPGAEIMILELLDFALQAKRDGWFSHLSNTTVNEKLLENLTKFLEASDPGRAIMEKGFFNLIVGAHGSEADSVNCYYEPGEDEPYENLFNYNQLAELVQAIHMIATTRARDPMLEKIFSSNSLKITLCICYAARSSEYFLDHRALKHIDFTTSFASNFLKVFHAYRDPSILVHLDAFTGEVAFDDDSGEYLVEPEQDVLLQIFKREMVYAHRDQLEEMMSRYEMQLRSSGRYSLFSAQLKLRGSLIQFLIGDWKGLANQVEAIANALQGHIPHYGKVIFQSRQGILHIDPSNVSMPSSKRPDSIPVNLMETVSYLDALPASRSASQQELPSLEIPLSEMVPEPEFDGGRPFAGCNIL